MDRTLHTILADRLAQDIREGRYPPGSMLPSEVDLARSNGLSRGTVRAALAALESDGLIDRRRGSGTRVLEGPAPSGFGQTVAKIDDLIQYARNTRRVVHSVKEIVLDRPLANLLGAEAGSRWIHIENLRIDPAQPQRPLCAVHTYLRAELAQATSLLAEETVAICDLIERTSGVRTAEIEQEFQATFVPEELAKALNAPAGAAALRILRRYHDASGWLFESSVSLHPADRFAYRMRLRRPG